MKINLSRKVNESVSKTTSTPVRRGASALKMPDKTESEIRERLLDDVRDYLIENFLEDDGNINIKGLDFEDFDRY